MGEFWADDPLGVLLNSQLRTDDGSCPFVAKGIGGTEVVIEHFNGGRDVTYVLVARGSAWQADGLSAAPTISFAPHVSGTSIIYDLTAGAMQGKARPFACDLRVEKQRLYALMPFQIESVGIHYEFVRNRCRLTIDFRDASDERIEAAMPFALQRLSLDPTCLGQKVSKELRITSREGKYEQMFDRPPFSSRTLEFVARSLLSGTERSAAFSVDRQIIRIPPREITVR